MDDTNVATAEPVSSPITNRYEKSADGQEIIDHHTGLIWRAALERGEDEDGETDRFTFDEAQLHAKQIAQQTGLAWRVPRVDELASLVDRNLTYPASSFPDRLTHVFWSSSPYVGDTSVAWYVFFDNGYVYSSYRYNTYAVRLVRGG